MLYLSLDVSRLNETLANSEKALDSAMEAAGVASGPGSDGTVRSSDKKLTNNPPPQKKRKNISPLLGFKDTSYYNIKQ